MPILATLITDAVTACTAVRPLGRPSISAQHSIFGHEAGGKHCNCENDAAWQ